MSLRSRMPKSVVPSVIAAGAVGTAALALATTGTLSAFAASITNSVNNTTTGTLILQEKSGTTTCTSTDSPTNAATCATINKYGGQTLAPGGSSTTTVTLTNLGTATPATFKLAAGACSQTGAPPVGTAASDLCSKVNVNVYAAATATGTPIYSGSLAAFNTTTLPALTPLAPNASQQYTFLVSVPATLDNTYQGLTASQSLTWTMSS